MELYLLRNVPAYQQNFPMTSNTEFPNVYYESVHILCREQNYLKKVLLCFRLRF